MNVMPYSLTGLHQAERRLTEAEQRRADLELGLMAARVSRRWRQVTRPVRSLLASRPESSGVACETR